VALAVCLTATSAANAGTPKWLPLRAPANVGCVKDNCGGYHGYWAIDLLDPARTAGDGIYAAGSGRVAGLGTYGRCLGDGPAAIGSRNARGNWVEVDHGGGVRTRYFHLRSITVRNGQVVKPTTKVGTMGNTGASTCRAPHLHFEKTVNGVKTNPGTLYACHGNRKVRYSNWNGSKGRSVRSNGVGCGAKSAKPKPKPKPEAADNRTFYLRNAHAGGGADVAFSYGREGDLPITGDWNGDGTTTVGLYRPSDRTFYLRNAHAGGGADVAFSYGREGDLPITGDWNGDGTTTVGLYRP
jgi:hypothetical protein